MNPDELIDQIIALKTAEQNWKAAQQWIATLNRLAANRDSGIQNSITPDSVKKPQ